MTEGSHTVRPDPDRIMVDLAEYALQHEVGSDLAYDTARYCLMDTLGCGLEALGHPECVKLLGPVVRGTIVPNGAKVPGTRFRLDPVQAAFSLGTMIRRLDYNDTWLGSEPCHPSDNVAEILSTADYLSRLRVSGKQPPLVMRDVLTAMIKAYEIQGVLALENSFNRVGLDHVILVKRSNANAIPVVFKDGSRTPKVSVEFPLGHVRQRKDGIPLLLQKFKINLARRYPLKQQAAILDLCTDRKRLESTAVHELVDMFAA